MTSISLHNPNNQYQNPLASIVSYVFHKFDVMIERNKVAHSLNSMSNRELEDIGISRVEIDKIVRDIK